MKEDKRNIQKLSRQLDVLDIVANSIVPSIYGHKDIKKAITLQLFGGTSEIIRNSDIKLGEIKILIVGDPGIGKTHLLKGISKLASNGVYIDSNKSNVDIENNPHLKKMESLNFLNVFLCLDALEIKSDDVAFLKDALGKKNNFNTKEEILNILNSDCSVLAAKNPRFGRFDRFKSLNEQLNIPSTILSCFDLIFVVEDRIDLIEDKKRAQHILKLQQNYKLKYKLDQNLLKNYINYAKDKIQPKLTNGAIKMLIEFYVSIRQGEVDDEQIIPITIRQLGALIKLSTAHARIRLSEEVTTLDVKIIMNLYQLCLNQVGYYPEIGNLDNFSLFNST